MNKKGMSWWILFWIILLFMIMTSIIRNSYYRQSMYNQNEYGDMYEEQLQQQLEEDIKKELYKDQIGDDIYDDMFECEYEPEYYLTDNMEIVLKCPTHITDQGEEIIDSELQTYKVTKVISGNTIELLSGEIIRLIGINAPESGEKCYLESKETLKDLVLDKEVILEKDIENKDGYGRLLRYVYVNDTFVNFEIVRLGFAHKYDYGSNTNYSLQFKLAENEAKQNKECLWKTEEIDYIQDKCIFIKRFNYNAVGNDNYNLNGEYVIFGNKCFYDIDMSGWTIKDETSSNIYTISNFIFQGGSTFILFSGIGTNSNFELYWGRRSGDYAAIWNNGGDTLFLRNSKGDLVLTQSYYGY